MPIERSEVAVDDHPSLGGITWALIAATATAAAAAMAARGLRLDWASIMVPVAFACLLLGGIRVYTVARPDARIVAALTAVLQLIVFTTAGVGLSYAVASLPGAFWDATFERWDEALGFDWRALLALANAHPRLAGLGRLTYASIEPQMIVLVLALALSGRLGALRLFVAAVVLAGLVSILVPAAMPALGTYVELQITPVRYDAINATSGLAFVPVIEALRAGTLRAVSLASAEGLVTFPSYHAALAVIFAWGWSRLRWLGWPGLALNLAMIVATPIYGGHYLVDILAGVALAAAALAGLGILVPRLAQALRHGTARAGSLAATE
jgi:membrane-associated phospholipid phosphatase